MLQKINTFCLITSSTQIEKILNIYKYYISETINKYGNFTVINFCKIDNKKILKNSKIFKNSEKKKINIFQPRNKNEFLEFVKNKKIIALDCLGKKFENFKLRFLIKKPNIHLILLLDSGNISNEDNIDGWNTEYKKFILLKKINKIIYRLFILLNLFPKTQLYFESRKKISENYINSKIRKFIKKFPFLKFLINFKKVYKINSGAYEDYIKFTKQDKVDSKKIIFIDGNYNHPDIVAREGINIKQKYFKHLKTKFFLIEKIFKKKIEICLHPSSNKREYQKFFKRFKIYKGKTREKIIKSDMVLFHESSSIMSALMSKKKIIILETDLLGKYLSKRISSYKKILGLPSIKLEDNIDFKKSDIVKKIELSKRNINMFVKKNLQSDNNNLPSKKFIKIIDQFIKNEK